MLHAHEGQFLYFARRAQQEQVASINANSVEAAAAHQRLSNLHAAKALMAALSGTEPVGSRVAPPQSSARASAA